MVWNNRGRVNSNSTSLEGGNTTVFRAKRDQLPPVVVQFVPHIGSVGRFTRSSSGAKPKVLAVHVCFAVGRLTRSSSAG